MIKTYKQDKLKKKVKKMMKNRVNKKYNSRFDSVMKFHILPKSKRSQVTIFIILAIAIILVLLLLFVGRDQLTTLLTGTSPVNTIRNCVLDSLEPALEVVSLQGGSLNPENYYLYLDNKVDYLCYTEENYAKCVMQKPLLKQSIEKDLKEYISPRAKSCVEAVKQSLAEDGYQVSAKEPEITVSLIPSTVLVEIKTDLRFTKDTTETHESIKVDTDSKLYDFAMVASSISNWEARYGDSETMNYMIYYPDLKVEKKKQGDGTTVYILTDRPSLDKFMFASRSVAVPAGITGA